MLMEAYLSCAMSPLVGCFFVLLCGCITGIYVAQNYMVPDLSGIVKRAGQALHSYEKKRRPSSGAGSAAPAGRKAKGGGKPAGGGQKPSASGSKPAPRPAAAPGNKPPRPPQPK